MGEREIKTYVLWEWSHGALQADIEECTWDEIVRTAWYRYNSDDCAFDGIEDVAADRYYTRAELAPLWVPFEEAERREWAAQPTPTHVIRVNAPASLGPSESARVAWLVGAEAAEAEAQKMRALFGADRITVEQLRPPVARRDLSGE